MQQCKRFAKIATWKGVGNGSVGRRVSGLLKFFRVAINRSASLGPGIGQSDLRRSGSKTAATVGWRGYRSGAAQPVCSRAGGTSRKATAQTAAESAPLAVWLIPLSSAATPAAPAAVPHGAADGANRIVLAGTPTAPASIPADVHADADADAG
eukprot:3662055-Pleurochrysis_carterae.AAC.1